MSSDRQQTSDDWDAMTKTPHALTREQCSLCTANRPRLCDQHYKQGADELLKHVTAAIQDQQTPGGVKATYEQLLELCNQQRQALAQQAQEVDIVSADLSEARHQIGLLQQRIDTHCMTEAELRQQVATIETNAADNGTLFRAVLNEKLTLAQEVVKYAEEAQGYLVKIEHLADQLAAMTAERDGNHKSLLVQLKANVGLAAKIVDLEAVVQAYHSREELHEGLKNKTLLTQQLAVSQARVRELENATPSMYPIMRGPSVPWEVMRPHESWAQKNHSQSLQQIANRGGLSPGEAWCVVNGIHCGIASKEQWTLWDAEWFKYAERVNLHYAQIATLQATLAERDARIKELEE